MTDTISRIQAKVTRAKEHVEDFQLRTSAFHDTKPYVIGIRAYPETGQRAYYLVRMDDVPLKLANIAADALGNLREAVDHVAYQLELSACGAPPKHRVYFPIARSAEHYQILRAAYIKCSDNAVMDAMDAIEPYQGGMGQGLWQLNALKNTDKHHLLVATRSISMGIDISPTILQTWKRDAPDWAKGITFPPLFLREVGPSLNVGDDLFLEPLNHVVDGDRQFIFDIAFDKPGVVESEPATKTLRNLTNTVDGVVSAFEPFLS